MLIAAVIILACGLVWVDVMRRKDKQMFVTKISSLQSSLGVGEIKRDVDPNTQTEGEMLAEAFDMEKELDIITKRKQEYARRIRNEQEDIEQNRTSNELKLKKTDEDYDSAF